jgi:hypothetical protein
MAGYTVRFYKGDYAARISSANFDRVMCYVEQHFNSSGGAEANFARVTVSANAPALTNTWGQWYATAVSAALEIPDHGLNVVSYPTQGYSHLRQADMPAVVCEPCFLSNPVGALLAVTRIDDLAAILVESIQRHFPKGGMVAFSVGHKYVPSTTSDRGGVTPDGQTEGDLAEQVLLKAKELLEAIVIETPESAPVSEPVQLTRIAEALKQESKSLSTSEVDYRRKARQWVINQGISDGSRPEEPVTREELWEMLYRALGKRE